MERLTQDNAQHMHQQLCTLADDFLRAAHASFQANNLNATATFAKPFRDLRSDAYIHPSIADVMSESLDYLDGPELKDVFKILLKAAAAKDPDAMALLERMAFTYARFSTPDVLDDDHWEDDPDDTIDYEMLKFYRPSP